MTWVAANIRSIMLVAGALTCTMIFAATAHAQDAKVERGKYMVLTGHCNNCHTAGYAQREGNVPEKDWLMGSGAQGWRGRSRGRVWSER